MRTSDGFLLLNIGVTCSLFCAKAAHLFHVIYCLESLFRFGQDLHGYIDCRHRARPSSIESQMREQLGKFIFADPILSGAGKMKG